jgi:hypothetical protein
MKQRPYITIFSLIVALTGLSLAMAADAGSTSGGERIQPASGQFGHPLRYNLSSEQMDSVHAGVPSSIPFIDPWRIWRLAVYCAVTGSCPGGR